MPIYLRLSVSGIRSSDISNKFLLFSTALAGRPYNSVSGSATVVHCDKYCADSDIHINNGECGQFVTDVYGRKLSTNVDLLEKYRYRAATTNVNWRHLVANLSLYKNESMLTMLGFPLTHFSDCQHPSQFVFVTASDRKYYHAALDAIGSLQWFFPNYTIYFYDLSNGSLRRKMARVSV